MQRAEWAQYYLRYHRALIADLARRHKLARQNYSRIFKSDARMPRGNGPILGRKR